MRGDDLEAREAIKRPLENQVLQGDRGVQWIADGVGQPAIALEALGEFWRALRVDEEYCAEFFRFGPDGVELWVGKVLAQHAAADCGAPQILLPDSILQLLHCKIRILK